MAGSFAYNNAKLRPSFPQRGLFWHKLSHQPSEPTPRRNQVIPVIVNQLTEWQTIAEPMHPRHPSSTAHVFCLHLCDGRYTTLLIARIAMPAALIRGLETSLRINGGQHLLAEAADLPRPIA
jgi:hypothetical protein